MSAESAVSAELRRLQAVNTVEGQLALNLARVSDRGAIGDSTGAAANAKQALALIAELRERKAEKAVTIPDQLRQRRNERGPAPTRRARAAQGK